MPPELTYLDVAMAAALLLVHGVVSIVLQLGSHGRLLLAALRMVVQLALVALVLRWLLDTGSPWWTLGAALFMVLAAGREVVGRQDRRLRSLWIYGLGTFCMFTAGVLVTLFALVFLVRPEPWYAPRYALPLLGLVLGNALTGVTLALHGLAQGLRDGRDGVEAQLSLGASRWVAVRPVMQKALVTALMPLLNSMAAAGIVFLPGIMTGQILAGVDPVDAVKYQVLVFFMLAGGTATGAVLAVIGGVLRWTDDRHRLRVDRMG